MRTVTKLGAIQPVGATVTHAKSAQVLTASAPNGFLGATPSPALQPFFSIPELAVRWRCSRGTIYNLLRGEKILDFTAPARRGRKPSDKEPDGEQSGEKKPRGKKLIPCDTVRRIEESNMRVFR